VFSWRACTSARWAASRRTAGPPLCCAVEEIGHGPAGWVGDVRDVFVAESAKDLHPHGHSVIFDDPQ
jgi:hypothetical protein